MPSLPTLFFMIYADATLFFAFFFRYAPYAFIIATISSRYSIAAISLMNAGNGIITITRQAYPASLDFHFMPFRYFDAGADATPRHCVYFHFRQY